MNENLVGHASLLLSRGGGSARPSTSVSSAMTTLSVWPATSPPSWPQISSTACRAASWPGMARRRSTSCASRVSLTMMVGSAGGGTGRVRVLATMSAPDVDLEVAQGAHGVVGLRGDAVDCVHQGPDHPGRQ